MVDLIAAYRAFVAVSERGSFTLGAAAARIPQPVASRRVAALEGHLRGRLFDRSGRRVTLTPLGAALLPSAAQVVRLVDAIDYDAETARRGPVRVAVPEVCMVADLAVLIADAAAVGVTLQLRPAGPSIRAEWSRLQQVQGSLTPVPAAEGRWTTNLGFAGRAVGDCATVFLETLRPSRDDTQPPPRIWVQPEDDLPHLADHLRRLADANGLQPTQVTICASVIDAAGAALSSADRLLCSRRQAKELALHWQPIGDVSLSRSHTLTGQQDLVGQLTESLGDSFARTLGADFPNADSPARGLL